MLPDRGHRIATAGSLLVCGFAGLLWWGTSAPGLLAVALAAGAAGDLAWTFAGPHLRRAWTAMRRSRQPVPAVCATTRRIGYRTPARWPTVGLGGAAVALGALTLLAAIPGDPASDVLRSAGARSAAQAARETTPLAISGALGLLLLTAGAIFLASRLGALARTRTASAECVLETNPAHLGGWLRAQVESTDVPAGATVRVALTNFRRLPSSLSDRPHYATYWSHAYRLRPDLVATRADGTRSVPVRFLLPPGAVPSSDAGGGDAVVWQLDLADGQGWHVTFEVPVTAASTARSHDARRAHAPHEGAEPCEPAFASIARGPGTALRVGRAPGRADAGRGWSSGEGDRARSPDVLVEQPARCEPLPVVACTLFLLLVLATAWRALVAGAPWTAAGFALLATTAALALIAFANHAAALRAGRDGIVTEHRIATLAWRRALGRDEVRRVELVPVRRLPWLRALSGATNGRTAAFLKRLAGHKRWAVDAIDAWDRRHRLLPPFAERGEATWLTVRLGDTLGVPAALGMPAALPETGSRVTLHSAAAVARAPRG